MNSPQSYIRATEGRIFQAVPGSEGLPDQAIPVGEGLPDQAIPGGEGLPGIALVRQSLTARDCLVNLSSKIKKNVILPIRSRGCLGFPRDFPQASPLGNPSENPDNPSI